jgi:hypothetical protein
MEFLHLMEERERKREKERETHWELRLEKGDHEDNGNFGDPQLQEAQVNLTGPEPLPPTFSLCHPPPWNAWLLISFCLLEHWLFCCSSAHQGFHRRGVSALTLARLPVPFPAAN